MEALGQVDLIPRQSILLDTGPRLFRPDHADVNTLLFEFPSTVAREEHHGL
jgi:hypothetical protein